MNTHSENKTSAHRQYQICYPVTSTTKKFPFLSDTSTQTHTLSVLSLSPFPTGLGGLLGMIAKLAAERAISSCLEVFPRNFKHAFLTRSQGARGLVNDKC